MDGYLTVKGETILGTDTTTDTTVKGDLTVEGTSSLEGTVTLGTDTTTDTTVKGDLNVEGFQTIFTSTLNPSDPSDPNDYDNSAVVVEGGVNIKQDLFVDGTIYGATDGTIETESLVLPSFLKVGGQTTLEGGVDLGSTSSITNAVDIDGSGDLTMGTITMTGFSVDPNGDTSVSTFDSSGATSLATGGGTVNIATSGQTTTVKGSLNVDQAVTLGTDNSTDTTVKGDLTVEETVTFEKTLDVTGDTSVSTFDSSGVTSLATGGGAVNIALSGNTTTVKGSLNVDEAVTLGTDNTTDTTVKGDLTVEETVTFEKTLDVTGDTSVSTFDSSGTTSLATGGGAVNIATSGGQLGFFSNSSVVQQNTTGTIVGFTDNPGLNVTIASTFRGSNGGTAYTIGDIVLALKNYGLLQS